MLPSMPALLKSYLKLSGNVIFEISEDFRFENVLTDNSDLLFLSQNQFLGRPVTDVVPPEFAHMAVEKFKLARSSTQVQAFEYQSPNAGDNRWFLGSVIYTADDNGRPFYLFSATDITEKKIAEQSLKFHADFEELLVHATSALIQSTEETFDSSLNGVLEKIGRFAGVDRTYLFQFDAELKHSSNTHEWCSEGTAPEIMNLQEVPVELVPNFIANLVRHTEIYISALDMLLESWAPEKAILEPQGIQSLLVIPVAAEGQLYGFIGFDAVKRKILWDTNQRHLLQILADNLGSVIMRNQQNRIFREATEKAKRLAEEATSANRYKSDFLASMSHEIRTPLNGVIGFSDLMMETKLTEIQQQYMEKVNHSARALLDVINQILDFSKIEAQKIELDIDRADLVEVVERTCDLVRYSAGNKEFDFIVRLQPDIPRYYRFDSLRLQQILVNLLSNSMKFTEKGFVELSVELIRKNEESKTAELYFGVRDSGIGISAEFQKRIFEAFAQADIRTNRKYGGTGLGVPIANSLLQMMGSSLCINSEIDKGSNFSFSVAFPYEEPLAFEREPVRPGSKALVVLCAERTRQMVAGLLRYKGFEEIVEEDAAHALQRISGGEQFDLVVVNKEQGLIGSTMISTIRKEWNIGTDRLPIILLHRSEDPRLLETIDKYNLVRVMEKPVTFTALAGAVDDIRSNKKHIQQREVKQQQAVLQTIDGDDISVLIAEDNKTNMLFTKIVVNKLFNKARLLEAKNGLEAVELFKTEKPSIILMDIQMPEMDGDEATGLIREHETDLGLTRTPILALTANAIAGYREKCLKLGFDDYVSKPVNKEELNAVIRRFFQQNVVAN